MEAAGIIRKGMMCGICDDFLRDAFNLPCGHNFCRECIDDALADRNACPTCMNPAWQKDTLKAAITDSVVQEWVTSCEAPYQAHMARLAKREIDGSESETDSAWDEASSQDDSDEDTDEEQNGEQEREKGLEQKEEGGQQQEEEEQEHEEAQEKQEKVDGEDSQPIATFSAKPAVQADTHQAREGRLATAAAAAASSVGPPPLASQALKEAANTRGDQDVTTMAASSPDAKPPARERPPPADGARQEKENVVAAPVPRPPRNASPSRRGDATSASAAAAAASTTAAAARKDSAESVVGVVGVEPSTVRRPSPRRNQPPRVRFQSSQPPLPPPRDCAAPESGRGSQMEEERQRKHSWGLPLTIAGGSSPCVVESAGGTGTVANRAGEPRFRPETPPLAQSVEGSMEETRSTGSNLAAELECRPRPPPSPRRDFEEGTSTPPVFRKPPEREADVEDDGGGGAGTSGDGSFAVGLPDTCDILDAESPPRPMGTTTELLVLTPPRFEVRKTAAATAGGGTVDSASVGEGCTDVAGPRASPAVSDSADVGTDVEGQSTTRASATDSPGKYGRRKNVSVLEDSRDGTRRPSSQGRVAEELYPEGSCSEDEASEAESVPLLCGGGGTQPGKNEQQHGPGQASPSRRVPSPRSSQRAGAVGEVSSSDQAEAATVTTTVFEKSCAEEGEDDDGEETCDEAGSPFHPSQTRVVVAADSHNGGERLPSPGVDSKQEDSQATGLQEPSKSDGLARVLGTGGDAPKESLAEPVLRPDCERVVPESLAPSLQVKSPEPCADELRAAGVASMEDPMAPEVSVRSTEVPKGTETAAAAGGVAERKHAKGLHVPDSCPAPGDGQGERRTKGGTSAPCQLQEEEEPGRRASGEKDVRSASCVTAARETKVASGSQAFGQPPSLQREEDDDTDGASVCERADIDSRDSRRQEQQASSRNGRERSLALEAGGSADRHPEGSLTEVPETLPLPRSAGTRPDEGSGPTRTVCLASQGSSTGPVEESACDGDHGSEAARQIPETALAESLTIQRTQSLTTQDVPETAHAWGTTSSNSAGACDGRVERPSPGALTTGDNTCPQSEVLETQQSRTDSTTQSSADYPEVRAGGGAGGRGSSEGNSNAQAADAGPARSLAKQQSGGSLPLSSSSPSSTLSEEAAVVAGSTLGGVNGLVGPDHIAVKSGTASPGSVGAGSGAVDARGTPDGHPPTKDSPVIGSRKRSADASATPSPGRSSLGSRSDGKRLRLTPPPSVAALTAAATPFGRPNAATGDVEPSKGSDKDGTRRREAEGGRRGSTNALADVGASPGASESEVLETDHDLAAVQDAWLAEGDYEFGGDTGYLDHVDETTEEVRPPSPPPIEVRDYPRGKSRSPRKRSRAAAVANPYAPQAHLDLHAGGDDCLSTGGAVADRGSTPGDEAETCTRPEGATAAKAREPPRPALRRPSKGMMSFSAPALGGVAVSGASSQSLSDSFVAGRLKEKQFHQSKNKILGAGRRHGGSGGNATVNASLEKSGSCSSWSTYDMGPDTQDVAELQALAATKWAKQNPSTATTASKPSRPDSIDLDDDDERVGQDGRLADRQGSVRGTSAADKKRKRTNTAAAPTSRRGKPLGQAAGARRAVSSNNNHETRRRPRRGRGHPAIVLLGCDTQELGHAKVLCDRLGQRLETKLVSEATHVVVGSQHTRASAGADGAGCSAAGEDDRRGGAGRHELRTHGLQGYREAVMLGLWVLDFSWVDACLRSDRRVVTARDERSAQDDLVEPSIHLPPPRDFELLGCARKHEGCEPRRGRFKRGSGVPGVFDGMAFCLVVVAAAEDARKRSSSCEPESSRLEAERLLKLGGGIVLAPSEIKRKPCRVGGEGFVDDPFGTEDAPASREDVIHLEKDGTTGPGGGGDNPANGNKAFILAVPEDCPDGTGRVSPRLSEIATRKRRELGAVAVVDLAWAVRSVELGFPVDFGEPDLGGADGVDDYHRQVGSSLSSKRPASKSRLSIRRGVSPRSEFLLDTEGGAGRCVRAPEPVNAERERTARLLREAEEMVMDPIRKPLPEFEVREDEFEFTRKGRKPPPKAQALVNATPVTYAAQNKAQRDLTAALDKAGYVDLNCSDPDPERRLAGFWFDFVYEGFYMRRSENAIPDAKRRGCPLDILRAEHDSHKDIQNDRSRRILKSPPLEYPIWKAGSGEDDAVELL